MPTFQPRITRSRFTFSPFSSEQMQAIGDVMCNTIRDRIRSGVNGEDNQAKALAPKYARRKMIMSRAPIRDWTWRGRTLRAMKVKSANQNQVTIGFIDGESNLIAHANNMRERAFTTSPNDHKVLVAAVRATFKQVRAVRFVKIA